MWSLGNKFVRFWEIFEGGVWRDLWRRSGTKRRQTNRGASRPIVVVGRIDVVGVVEVETERAVGPWSGMCQGEVA